VRAGGVTERLPGAAERAAAVDDVSERYDIRQRDSSESRRTQVDRASGDRAGSDRASRNRADVRRPEVAGDREAEDGVRVADAGRAAAVRRQRIRPAAVERAVWLPRRRQLTDARVPEQDRAEGHVAPQRLEERNLP